MNNDNNEKYLSQSEALDVEMAKLSTHEKFLTRITISSLRLLKQIAAEEGMKIDELTPSQIIRWFEQDAEIKRLSEGDATSTQGKTIGSLEW